jgi:hypothetical protein
MSDEDFSAHIKSFTGIDITAEEARNGVVALSAECVEENL